MLHRFNDNSTLKKINVKELITIPVWRGNRYIDLEHANEIRKAIGNNIESLDTAIFRLIKYKDGNTQQIFLIDGQHRQYVLRKYFEESLCPPSFDVLVIEKDVDGESDAIEYFNTLNNVKPQFENDPKILANKYIHALEKKYNKTKTNSLIRPEGKTTRRPFLSSDDLRSKLEENYKMLKQSNDAVERFIQRVDLWNSRRLKEIELEMALDGGAAKKSLYEACISKKFVLALDNSLKWVYECLE
jgi:hypothetical protein